MPTDALPPEVQRELDAIDAALAGRPVDHELTELGALALALRDERAEPSREFGADLDRRAAAGFQRPRRRRFAWPSAQVLGPALAALLLVIAVVPAALISDNSGQDDSA